LCLLRVLRSSIAVGRRDDKHAALQDLQPEMIAHRVEVAVILQQGVAMFDTVRA